MGLDRTFAEAWAGESLALSELYMAFVPDEQVRSKAMASADRALQLDPESWLSNLAAAMVEYRLVRDYEATVEYLRRADDARPRDPEVLLAWAYVSRRMGDWETSLVQHRRALDLQPRVARGRGGLVWTLINLRRYEEAQELMSETLEMFPDMRGFRGTASELRLIGFGDVAGSRDLLEGAESDLGSSREGLDWFRLELYSRDYDAALRALPATGAELQRSQVHALLGEEAEQRSWLERSRETLEGRGSEGFADEASTLSLLALTYADLGLTEQALDAARRSVELMPTSRDAVEGPRILERAARTYARVGDPDRAVSILARLLSMPSEVSTHTLRLDPRYDGLRARAGFKALMEG